MTRLFGTVLSLLPAAGLAEAYQRPIPQAQSATAKFWFAVGAFGLLVSLVAVHKLVMRR